MGVFVLCSMFPSRLKNSTPSAGTSFLHLYQMFPYFQLKEKKKQKNLKERNWRESTRRTNDRRNRFVQRKQEKDRSVKTTIHDDNRALQGQCDPTRSAICRSTAPIHRSKHQSYSSQKLQHPSLTFASRACCSARGSSSSTTHSHQRFLSNARSPIDTQRNQGFKQPPTFQLVDALLRLPGYVSIARSSSLCHQSCSHICSKFKTSPLSAEPGNISE